MPMAWVPAGREKTIGWGIAMQIALAVAVTQFAWVQSAFQLVGNGIKVLIDCSDKGAEFVFGSLSKVDGPVGFVFAFKALPPIIFVSASIALFESLIGGIKPLLLSSGLSAESLNWFPNDLTLSKILGTIFQPVAMLMGVPIVETPQVGSLLGIKLAANEHVAYVTLTKDAAYAGLSDRAKLLSVYALTGFANFSSIGIQLGGIGALAPERRSDLAKLGMMALFVGFLATVLNAAVAGLLIR